MQLEGRRNVRKRSNVMNEVKRQFCQNMFFGKRVTLSQSNESPQMVEKLTTNSADRLGVNLGW